MHRHAHRQNWSFPQPSTMSTTQGGESALDLALRTYFSLVLLARSHRDMHVGRVRTSMHVE